MTNPTVIAQRIETARATERRSVAWLSEQTGIAEKTYRRRLASPEQFTLDELARVTRALGTELEDVFTEVPKVAA